MTTIYLLLAVSAYGLSLLCEWAERKSRRWYQDRLMLRLSGFFFALGTVSLALAIAL